MDNLRSLVLNSAFEPLQFTAARRALVLVLLGKAEALETDGFSARTSTVAYRLPTVIRLYRYVRKPGRYGVAFSRKNVLRRDGHTCQYCGEKAKELTIDHVIPKSQGGQSIWENVVAACRRCNLKKGNKFLSDSGLILRVKPRKPSFLLHSSISENIPKSHLQSWAKYLPKSEMVEF